MPPEYPETSFIQFAGWQEEDFHSRDAAFNAALHTYFKMHDMLKHQISLYIHVKKYEEKPGKKKYSITARLNSPGKFFEAKSVEWDFLSAVQDAMHTLEKEVAKKIGKEKGKRYSKQVK